MKLVVDTKNEIDRIEEFETYLSFKPDTIKKCGGMVQLASDICGTSMAALAFVGKDKVKLEATIGLQDVEIPRQALFAEQEFSESEYIEVDDVSTDSRFANASFLALGRDIHFFAAVPLDSEDGHRIGFLCLWDDKPKKLSSKEKQGLMVLGEQVMAQLDLSRQLMKLSHYQEEIDQQEVTISKLQKQLVRTLKFSSMGQMAGGIAHEINNPLAIIKGLMFRLKMAAKKGRLEEGYVSDLAKHCEEGIDRISNIIKSLVSYTHTGGALAVKPFDMAELVHNQLAIYKDKPKSRNIKFIEDLPEKLEVNASKVQLGQALIGIIDNAIDAVEGVDDPTIKVILKSQDEENVEVAIIDNGCGVLEEHLHKVTAPFFTTKESASATGMGLTLACSGVAGNKGGLFLTNNADEKGVTVKLQFPADVSKIEQAS